MGNKFSLELDVIEETAEKTSAMLETMESRTGSLVDKLNSFMENWEGESKEAFKDEVAQWEKSKKFLIEQIGTFTKYLSNEKAMFKLFGHFDILDGFDIFEDLTEINDLALEFDAKVGGVKGSKKTGDKVSIQIEGVDTQKEKIKSIQADYNTLDKEVKAIQKVSFKMIDNPADMESVGSKIVSEIDKNHDQLEAFSRALTNYQSRIEWFENQVVQNFSKIKRSDTYKDSTLSSHELKMFMVGKMSLEMFALRIPKLSEAEIRHYLDKMDKNDIPSLYQAISKQEDVKIQLFGMLNDEKLVYFILEADTTDLTNFTAEADRLLAEGAITQDQHDAMMEAITVMNGIHAYHALYGPNGNYIDAIYDPNGKYGGRQGDWRTLVDKKDPVAIHWALNYLDNSGIDWKAGLSTMDDGVLSDEDLLYRYVDIMGSVGCAYMAITNTIFSMYADRPEDFYRDFGYPMFMVNSSENYSMNFDRMMIDVYTTGGKIGHGLVSNEVTTILDNYLQDTSTTATIVYKDESGKKIPVTRENMQNALDNHNNVIILSWNINYFNDLELVDGYSGNPVGGHAYVPREIDLETGVTKVSSWSHAYYIDPDSFTGTLLGDPIIDKETGEPVIDLETGEPVLEVLTIKGEIITIDYDVKEK